MIIPIVKLDERTRRATVVLSGEYEGTEENHTEKTEEQDMIIARIFSSPILRKSDEIYIIDEEGDRATFKNNCNLFCNVVSENIPSGKIVHLEAPALRRFLGRYRMRSDEFPKKTSFPKKFIKKEHLQMQVA